MPEQRGPKAPRAVDIKEEVPPEVQIKQEVEVSLDDALPVQPTKKKRRKLAKSSEKAIEVADDIISAAAAVEVGNLIPLF